MFRSANKEQGSVSLTILFVTWYFLPGIGENTNKTITVPRYVDVSPVVNCATVEQNEKCLLPLLSGREISNRFINMYLDASLRARCYVCESRNSILD